MSTIKTLAPRIALAAGISFAAASLYAYVGQSQAESRALTFCSSAQPGEAAGNVLSRLQQELDEATAFQSQTGVSLVYGKTSQYVCDIRFSGDQVAVAAVTPLN